MGAYENPVQAIDTKSGLIIANAIANIGKQTQNAIEKYAENENDIFKKATEKEFKRQEDANKNAEKLYANIDKANVKNQTWYDMTTLAINTKYDLETKLQSDQSLDVKQRQELTNAIEYQKQSIRYIMNSITDIKDWQKTEGALLTGPTNVPGGIFTGNMSEDSSEFEKEVGRNLFLKQALMGIAIKEDGKLVGNPIFFMKQIEDTNGNKVPQLHAYLPGEGKDKSFNVSEVINKDLAVIENIEQDTKENGVTIKGINTIWRDLGIQNKNGEILPGYFQRDEQGVPITEKVIIGRTDENPEGTGTAFINLVDVEKVVQASKQQFKGKFDGMTSFTNDYGEYARINSTYLKYADGDAKDLATVKPGVYTLTEEAEKDFTDAMLKYSMNKFINGYEVIGGKDNGDGTVTYIDSQGKEVTTKFVTPTVRDSYVDEFGFKRNKDKSEGFKFNKAQEVKITDTVEQFKSGKGYNKLIGETIDGKKITEVQKGKDGKVTFIYDEKISSTEKEAKGIPGYEGVELTKAQLIPLVTKYLNNQYGTKSTDARYKMRDQIVEDLLNKEVEEGNNEESGTDLLSNFKDK